MQISSSYNNAYYPQKNFSADQSVKKTENVKEDDKILTYEDIEEQSWEDYANGKVDPDVHFRLVCASLTASLVEASKDGFQGNPFGEMKRVQQERLKADTPSEIAVEINKDIFALNNNFNAVLPGMTKEENQRLNNKAKDFLFEILQDIKV
ncbi:hypothetical protein [Campylobacter sp. US33a]|uniref:hypothetical protein n=1 Tax=Campylobacter sp. US33a TaxID=2498120 RepID=UPI001068484A|nr:hypothetical protein [Campylobacter sp. US33a]TEY04072.1 hypothetical protein ELQ16_02190 [Campylobacter sp. US33a]